MPYPTPPASAPSQTRGRLKPGGIGDRPSDFLRRRQGIFRRRNGLGRWCSNVACRRFDRRLSVGRRRLPHSPSRTEQDHALLGGFGKSGSITIELFADTARSDRV
jgi:hypothetical protein